MFVGVQEEDDGFFDEFGHVFTFGYCICGGCFKIFARFCGKFVDGGKEKLLFVVFMLRQYVIPLKTRTNYFSEPRKLLEIALTMRSYKDLRLFAEAYSGGCDGLR